MITCAAWAGKRYGVLGLARSGAATVRALVASGARVVAWDADEGRREPLVDAVQEQSHALDSVHLKIADLDGIDLPDFDALVVSPGVPLNTHPLAARARAAGVPIIGDIELFAQARSALPPHKVVGITGTNGKSTTTALVHHILQTAGVPSLTGGNIGLPILAQEPLPAGGVYVLELSSYQIDLTFTLDCDVAVLTNITPDHLDRYDGFEAYAASKARLFAMQAVATKTDNRTGFINTDDPVSDDWYVRIEQQELFGDRWRNMQPIGSGIPSSFGLGQADLPTLSGRHNAANAMAAIAVCGALHIPDDVVRGALRTFPGLPHRTERVGEVAGVAYVNDSKATNPESAAPALAAYPRVHWIVGGRAKGDDLDACRPGLSHVVRAYTIGEAGPRFAAVLTPDVAVTECGTLDVAVRTAAAAAQAGDTVLLSPAAASFDQFRDFEARGEAFRALVEELGA